MSGIVKLLRTETALVLGLVQAGIALGASFGLRLSADQIGTIMAVVAAMLALVARSQVTPVVAGPTLPATPPVPPPAA